MDRGRLFVQVTLRTDRGGFERILSELYLSCEDLHATEDKEVR